MGLTLRDQFNNIESGVIGEHIRTNVDPVINPPITPTILSNATITTNPAPTSGNVSLLVDGFFIQGAISLTSTLGLSFDEVLNKNLIFNNDGSPIEIIFDLGDKFLVNNIIIYSLLDISLDIAYVPKTVFLLTSDDGINFNIPLTNVTNTNFGTQKGSLTFDTTFKRYFKLIITEVNYISTGTSFDTSKLAINEIQFKYNKEQPLINTQTFTPSTNFEHPIKVDVVDGWNIIGYPHPYESNVRKEFYSFIFGYPPGNKTNNQIDDDLTAEGIQILKDNFGNFYWPAFRFMGLGNPPGSQNGKFIPGQGYALRTTEAFDNSIWLVSSELGNINADTFLDKYGTLEKYKNELSDFEYEITAGWNTISYNRFEERPLISEMGDNIDFNDINIVKNNDADFFWPEFDFDNIGNLIPGQGYQIRTKDVAITTPLFNPVNIPEGIGIPLYLTHPDAAAEDQTSIDNF